MSPANHIVAPMTRGGRWLRRRRLAAGLTQGQLAKRLGVSIPWISRRETGAGPLLRRDRLAIEAVLKV